MLSWLLDLNATFPFSIISDVALDDAEMAGNLIFAFKHALETGKIEPIEIPEKIDTPKETNVENCIEEKQDNNSPNEGGLFSFLKRLFN